MRRAFSPSVIAAAFLAAFSVLAFFGSRVIGRFGAPETPLAEFYVGNLIRTSYETAILLAVTALLVALYAFIPKVRDSVRMWVKKIGDYLDTCSLGKYALISHALAALVLFILNAPGILYGTFMIDDYKMYAIATERSLWELFWTPINEHVIPLFWLELKAMFFFFGTNPPPLNFPLFFSATIAIGSAATLMRMLRFGPSTLVMILVLFASTTIVSHQLYGFYAIAPYFQVLALFTLSLIFFVKARENSQFPRLHAFVSFFLIILSVFLESGGVWTPIAYGLFALAYRAINTDEWRLFTLIRKEFRVLVASFSLLVVYAAYLFYLSTVATETFFGPSHVPFSLATIRGLYDVLTAGTLLSLFAPRLGLILSQPRFVEIIPYWQLAMGTLFTSYAFVVGYALLRGSARVKGWVTYFTLLVLGTALLVAIARPSSHATSFYRDQNLLFPLFFMTLALAAFASEWMRNAVSEKNRELRIWIVCLFLVIVFAGQQTFSFYKIQYYEDIVVNNALVERLQETLVPALQELTASRDTPLSIPTLSALFLEDGYQQFPDLSALSTFLGIQDVEWLSIDKGPYRASTSPAFLEALQKDEGLRSLYLTKGEVVESCASESFGNARRAVKSGETVRLADSLDPSRAHVFFFDISAEDAPEKIFLDISFQNDFGLTDTVAHIRLDQYTPAVESAERRYACQADLNQIPAFALSRAVRNVSITVTAPGSYVLHEYRFEGR
ncbi:hypothetical protein C4585_02005 [Candidatus Parcubacteria bacterium]|nr:MAG: hypothetical protein C4585_02005 [Candidatus Parcubacteria bacterium]